MAKSFPKPLRALNSGGRTRASNSFAGDDAAIDVIEGHDHEIGNFGHTLVSHLTARIAPARASPWSFFSLSKVRLLIFDSSQWMRGTSYCDWNTTRFVRPPTP
jgi:hypothetical protein